MRNVNLSRKPKEVSQSKNFPWPTLALKNKVSKSMSGCHWGGGGGRVVGWLVGTGVHVDTCRLEALKFLVAAPCSDGTKGQALIFKEKREGKFQGVKGTTSIKKVPRSTA